MPTAQHLAPTIMSISPICLTLTVQVLFSLHYLPSVVSSIYELSGQLLWKMNCSFLLL